MDQPFTTQSCVLGTPTGKTFKNIVGIYLLDKMVFMDPLSCDHLHGIMDNHTILTCNNLIKEAF